ncbi:MAG: tetratricopeptide repeat protein [Winogradskyella sp.]|uniref:tetratricopeptide repeat protein n=1 Tax=Winogradskyella sp. TaxID=1883156 RepID=UPI0025F44EA2|nr:tetratricopeptide repeat protein [Winogradskyella sp.]NRB59083.1 tetratricopeptide repeat protein [Winogradskyella sp.]
MKKLMTLVLTLVLTTMSFAQKNEIKAIEKALKSSNFSNAKSAVSAAEGLMANMDDKTISKFYFLKAKALYANGAATDADIEMAVSTLEQLKNHEAKIGKKKYTEQADEIKTEIYNTFLKKANDAFNKKNLGVASKAYANIYKISSKDTIYLYNAALLAAQNNDYDTSLKHFIKLKELGYTGIKMNYTAVNKETGGEEFFPEKANRDFAVKTLKTHIKPVDKLEESKRANIVKNIAFIYVSQGKNEEALTAIDDARKEFPEDNNLVLTEATIQIKVGNSEAAFELFREALRRDPNNPDLNYNVGITAMEVSQNEVAKEAFSNALRIKPDYANAALNLSFLEVSKGNALNDEMNSLGNSAADNKRYDELREEKNVLFTAGAKILEDFISNNPSLQNADIFNQLANIYSALGEVDKYKANKAKAEEIKAAGN